MHRDVQKYAGMCEEKSRREQLLLSSAFSVHSFEGIIPRLSASGGSLCENLGAVLGDQHHVFDLRG